MHFSIITSRSLQKHASLTVLFGDDGRISDGRWCKERCKDMEKCSIKWRFLRCLGNYLWLSITLSLWTTLPTDPCRLIHIVQYLRRLKSNEHPQSFSHMMSEISQRKKGINVMKPFFWQAFNAWCTVDKILD